MAAIEELSPGLEEPFLEEGTRDPMDPWPMNRNQVLFAAASDPTPPGERY